MALTVEQKIQAATRHGIKNAGIAYDVWRNRTPKPEGFDYALVCALLVKETAGGINEFGHDPTIFVGAGLVTKAKYLAYRKLRNSTGKMQGVGTTQLTWRGYQDEADKAGGCWLPRPQMHIGFVVLRNNIRAHGLFAGVAAYNGTGLKAQNYARSVLTIQRTFQAYLSTAKGPRLSPLARVAAVEPYEPTLLDLGQFKQYERALLRDAALGDEWSKYHIARNEPDRVPAKGDPAALS